jgi:hypothetical protein
MSNTKTELMLALWPTSNNRQYWSTDANRSMWLALRSVEQVRGEDGEVKIDLDCYGIEGVTIRDVGLWVWSSSGFNCHVELKGHDIHSAGASDLTRLAKWLTKMNTKIAKADIPRDFGVLETLILTLRAMGIKQAVEINPDWTARPRYKIHSLADGLKLPNYAAPLAEMEEIRLKPYGSAA